MELFPAVTTETQQSFFHRSIQLNCYNIHDTGVLFIIENVSPLHADPHTCTLNAPIL